MDAIECANPSCCSLNPETASFCEVCGTPVEKRFLWVPGEPFSIGDLERPFRERYRPRGANLLLDGQPGRPPLSVDTVPLEAQPYLRLFPWRLHLPQVYGVMPVGDQLRLLLVDAPLLAKEYGEHLPQRPVAQALGAAWGQASAFRQLNWLWQMARLWPALSYQQVAGSLLRPQLLRVEGPLLRLRELVLDQDKVTLAQLGALLQRLVPSAQPQVGELLAQWCEAMLQQQLTSAEEWLGRIEQALTRFRVQWHSQVQVTTQTDPGPTRRRNEDACYPPPHQSHTDRASLAVVCDGIGGHEGGDVAAKLVVEAVSQHLHPQSLAKLDAKAVTQELATVICQANDRLTHLNNQQQRQERQRMGTTLTLAFVRDYELFVANVGDSRAYWVTPYGCYQVTTDDDVASREVRLGYRLYPQAVRQPAAGALVQALGISASNVLHPAVQRLLLDEDCLLLLCSDGLSDNHLVDQYWLWELLPVLRGERDVATATQRLIDLANRRNGHDNVTVVLCHYQLAAADGRPPTPAQAEPLSRPLPPPASPAVTVPGRRPSRVWLLGLLGGLLLMATGAGWWWYEQRRPSTGENAPSSPPAPVPRWATTPTVLPVSELVSALAMDPQGERLALASEDGSIHLWWVAGLELDRRLRSTGSPVMGLAFVQQGQQLVSCDRRGLQVWSVTSGQLVSSLTAPKGVVTALATDSLGRFLAVGDANGTIHLWDLQRYGRDPVFRQTLPALGKIDALAVRADGALVAAGSQGQARVEVWDVARQRRRYTLAHPELRQGVWSLAFRPDGQVLAVGSGVDGRVVLWEMGQGHELRTWRAPGIVYDLVFSPDGAWLLTATGTVGEPGIRVWNPVDGALVATLRGHQEAVKHLALSANGQLLVSSGDDQQVLLWRVQP